MKELIQALINQGIITVTDIQRMTTLELLLIIIKRVNELHGLTKEGLEAVQRLLDKGFQEEVVAQLNEWLQDGTFDTLINQTALKEISTQLSSVKTNSLYLEDFKTADNTYTDALKLCINEAVRTAIKKIKLPKGNIDITETIYIGGNESYWNFIFEGCTIGIDNRGTSFTNKTDTGYLFNVDLSKPVAGEWHGISFRDVTFRGVDKLNSGIKLTSCQQAEFSNCQFLNLHKAVIVRGDSHYVSFKRCQFNNNNIGVNDPLSTDSDYVVGDANNCYFESCMFTNNTTPINQRSSSGWVFNNCDFEGGNGTIILNNSNRLNSIRLERNPQGLWLTANENNIIDVNCHAIGGHAGNPVIHLTGDDNEVLVSGTSYAGCTQDDGLVNNKIDYRRYVGLLPFMMFENVSSTLNFKNDNNKILTNDLTQFTGAGLEWNDSAKQIIKNTDGYSFMKIDYTPKTDVVYVTLKQSAVAGGGFVFGTQTNTVSLTDFPLITDDGISIYQLKVKKGVTQTLMFVNEVGGIGSSIRIREFCISEFLHDKLLSQVNYL